MTGRDGSSCGLLTILIINIWNQPRREKTSLTITNLRDLSKAQWGRGSGILRSDVLVLKIPRRRYNYQKKNTA